MMDELISQFFNYLLVERGFSKRTVEAYKHDLDKFRKFLFSINKTDIKEITKDDIRAFLTYLALNGYKKPNLGVTRARKLSAIKSFFKYFSREGVLTVNPAADIETPKIPKKEAKYLTSQEYGALIRATQRFATPYFQNRDLAIVVLFLGTGIRLSELANLTTNSINLSEKIIKVMGKGDKERTIPLNDQVVKVLERYLKTRHDIDGNHLFISRKANKLSVGSVHHLIKNYLRKSGIQKENISVHSLRHSFGASLLNSGVNIVVIQELLGHKNLETTRRYLHINNEDLRNAVNHLVLR